MRWATIFLMLIVKLAVKNDAGDAEFRLIEEVQEAITHFCQEAVSITNTTICERKGQALCGGGFGDYRTGRDSLDCTNMLRQHMASYMGQEDLTSSERESKRRTSEGILSILAPVNRSSVSADEVAVVVDIFFPEISFNQAMLLCIVVNGNQSCNHLSHGPHKTSEIVTFMLPVEVGEFHLIAELADSMGNQLRSSDPVTFEVIPCTAHQVVPRRLLDCFTFFNELDVLEIRLQELYEVVDVFIVVESPTTFQGEPKPLYLRDSLHHARFDLFRHKIVLVVADMGNEGDIQHDAVTSWGVTWSRERRQRNAIRQGLAAVGAEASDLVIFSDIDEIPTSSFVNIIKSCTSIQLPVMPGLGYYNYHFHWRAHQSLDYLYMVSSAGLLSIIPPHELRGVGFDGMSTETVAQELIGLLPATRILNAGWHMSSFSVPEEIARKLESFAHSEYNTQENKDLARIAERVAFGRDLFGRDNMQDGAPGTDSEAQDFKMDYLPFPGVPAHVLGSPDICASMVPFLPPQKLMELRAKGENLDWPGPRGGVYAKPSERETPGDMAPDGYAGGVMGKLGGGWGRYGGAQLSRDPDMHFGDGGFGTVAAGHWELDSIRGHGEGFRGGDRDWSERDQDEERLRLTGAGSPLKVMLGSECPRAGQSTARDCNRCDGIQSELAMAVAVVTPEGERSTRQAVRDAWLQDLNGKESEGVSTTGAIEWKFFVSLPGAGGVVPKSLLQEAGFHGDMILLVGEEGGTGRVEMNVAASAFWWGTRACRAGYVIRIDGVAAVHFSPSVALKVLSMYPPTGLYVTTVLAPPPPVSPEHHPDCIPSPLNNSRSDWGFGATLGSCSHPQGALWELCPKFQEKELSGVVGERGGKSIVHALSQDVGFAVAKAVSPGSWGRSRVLNVEEAVLLATGGKVLQRRGGLKEVGLGQAFPVLRIGDC